MKVILYGGSFDPIHAGHQQVVEQLSRQFADHQVWVLPTANWMKPEGLFTIPERINFCEQLFKSLPNVTVLDWSLTQDTRSTYVVAQKINKLGHEVRIALGEDNLATFPQWKQAEDLLQGFKFILIPRQGYQLLANPGHPLAQALVDQALILPFKTPNISSTALKQDPTAYQAYLSKVVYQALLKKI